MPLRNNTAKGGSSPVPCSVSSTRREVIENKLLAALDDAGTVAILANEEMLDDLIWVMENYIGASRDRQDRMESIHADLSQLREAAFPRNAELRDRPESATPQHNQPS